RASWCGLLTWKPSLGRIPMDPPYVGRVAGPMTRTVADSARLMAVLSQPDPRDSMSLPDAEIPWLDLEDRDLRGARIGLMMDAGVGLPVEAEVAEAVRVAADTLAKLGAVVKPI